MRDWFRRNDDPPQRWSRVILWWEVRRPLFNGAFIFFAGLVLMLISSIIKDGGGGSPIFLLFVIVATIFAVNALYTCGWILDLIIRKYGSRRLQSIRPALFTYVLGATCALYLSVHALITINAVIQEWVTPFWK